MGEDAFQEFQKEWRAIVLTKLDSLDKGQQELKTEIGEIKASFASQQALETMRDRHQKEIETLREKIGDLENFKGKAIGVVLTLHFLTGVVIYWLRSAGH